MGHRVVAISRRPHDFSSLPSAERITNLVVSRLYDEESVQKTFADCFNCGEVPTGIVYGAAMFHRYEDIKEMNLSDWEEVMRVNVIGAFIWARAFIEFCKTRAMAGSIVNISSQAAFTGGYGGVIPYASSKGALNAMTKGLAREFATDNIRVNCVAPGFIETGAMRGKLDEGQLEKFFSRVPMRRFGTVSEVAQIVAFLLSDASSYITGATIDVTGGQLMH